MMSLKWWEVSLCSPNAFLAAMVSWRSLSLEQTTNAEQFASWSCLMFEVARSYEIAFWSSMKFQGLTLSQYACCNTHVALQTCSCYRHPALHAISGDKMPLKWVVHLRGIFNASRNQAVMATVIHELHDFLQKKTRLYQMAFLLEYKQSCASMHSLSAICTRCDGHVFAAWTNLSKPVLSTCHSFRPAPPINLGKDLFPVLALCLHCLSLKCCKIIRI